MGPTSLKYVITWNCKLVYGVVSQQYDGLFKMSFFSEILENIVFLKTVFIKTLHLAVFNSKKQKYEKWLLFGCSVLQWRARSRKSWLGGGVSLPLLHQFPVLQTSRLVLQILSPLQAARRGSSLPNGAVCHIGTALGSLSYRWANSLINQ